MTKYAYRGASGVLHVTPRHNLPSSRALDEHSLDMLWLEPVKYYDENGKPRYYMLEGESTIFLSFLRDVGNYSLDQVQAEARGFAFVEPFVDLYNRRDGLHEFLKQSETAPAGQDPLLNDKIAWAEAVLGLLDNEFAATTKNFDSFRSSNPPTTISFENLWMIYRPGSLEFAQPEGEPPFAFMIDSVTYREPAFPLQSDRPRSPNLVSLHGWHVDKFTGREPRNFEFGRRSYKAEMLPFEGERPISKLQFVPEAFFADEATKSRIRRGGSNFWQLTAPSFRQVIRLDKFGSRTMERERIMVDTESILEDPGLANNDDFDDASTKAAAGRKPPDKEIYRGSPVSALSRSLPAEYHAIDPSSEPTELMLLVCPPTVRGFSLREKTWCKDAQVAPNECRLT